MYHRKNLTSNNNKKYLNALRTQKWNDENGEKNNRINEEVSDFACLLRKKKLFYINVS